MLYAIPSCNGSLSQHFSKAPQITLWDSQTKIKQTIDLPESSACCGHKKGWQQVLQQYKVDAVVVRLIGTNMLNTLFKLNLSVLSAPRDFDLAELNIKQLAPVTQIAYARPSAKSKKSCCSGKSVAHSSKTIGSNKLAPGAVKYLNKVLKLSNYTE